MQKVILHFLVLLLSLPYLACAMPSCENNTLQVASDNSACANHEKSSEDKNTAEIMFLSDCSQVDQALLQADISPKRTDIQKDLDSSDPIIGFTFTFIDFEQDTEPWLVQNLLSSPDIFLLTQRLRL